MRAYEVLTALSAVAEIILEETAENNRIQLESDGGALVSIYPQCAGSVSDKDVQADPEKYGGATIDTSSPVALVSKTMEQYRQRKTKDSWNYLNDLNK